MNIIKQPQTWNPAYNPIIYQFGSTFSGVLFFEVNLKDIQQNAIILTDKAYVTPVAPTSSDYNFSDVARDLVSYEINTDVSIEGSIDKSVREVNLLVRESGLNGTTIDYLTATFSTTPIKVWNSKFNRNSFTDFTYQSWVAESGSSQIKFLTTKPNGYVTNDSSREYLYFLKNPTYSFKYTIESLTSTYSTISSFSATISSTSSMVRLDVSPKVINGLNSGFLTASINTQAYSVQLFDGTQSISEKKIYQYESGYPCGIDVVNVLWENDLGGIDSYQFINPIETREVERVNQQKNQYRYFGGDYTDINKNVYNQTDRIVDSNLNSTYKMWTKPLTDDENNWIAGLLHTKNVFIELVNRRIYPVNLVETSYTVERGKFNPTAPIQSEWSFKVNRDYINADTIIGDKSPVVPTTTTTTTSTTTTTTTSNVTTSTTTTTTTSPVTTSTTTTTTTQGGLTYSFFIYGSNNPSDACNGILGGAYQIYSTSFNYLENGQYYYQSNGLLFESGIFSWYSANIYGNGCYYGYFSGGQFNIVGFCSPCYP